MGARLSDMVRRKYLVHISLSMNKKPKRKNCMKCGNPFETTSEAWYCKGCKSVKRFDAIAKHPFYK